MKQFIACSSEGYDGCMHNMGWMWETGRIKGSNPRDNAIGWYTLGARHGNQMSRVALTNLGATVPAADLLKQEQPLDPQAQKAMNDAAGAIGGLLGTIIFRKK